MHASSWFSGTTVQGIEAGASASGRRHLQAQLQSVAKGGQGPAFAADGELLPVVPQLRDAHQFGALTALHPEVSTEEVVSKVSSVSLDME